MENIKHTVPIYVWIENENGDIKKSKTTETLEICDQDYLFYCPICGKRIPKLNLDTSYPKKVCPSCHNTVSPYKTKYPYKKYDRMLKNAKKETGEENLNVDDLVMEEEIIYLPTFKNGLTFTRKDRYRMIYSKGQTDTDSSNRNTIKEKIKRNFDEQIQGAKEAVQDDIDYYKSLGKKKDSMKYKTFNDGTYLKTDPEMVCPLCYSNNVFETVGYTSSPMLFSDNKKYMCLNCRYQFNDREMQMFIRDRKEGIE